MIHDPKHVGGELKCIDGYPEHLQMIGLVITNWSLLEGRLALALWELVGSPDRGSVMFYSIPNFRGRATVIRVLAQKSLDGAMREEFLEALEEAERLSELRNRIAHGQWGVPADAKRRADPFLSSQQPARKVEVFEHVYTVKELRELADRITASDHRFAWVLSVIRAKRDPKLMASEARFRQVSPEYDSYWKRFE